MGDPGIVDQYVKPVRGMEPDPAVEYVRTIVRV